MKFQSDGSMNPSSTVSSLTLGKLWNQVASFPDLEVTMALSVLKTQSDNFSQAWFLVYSMFYFFSLYT